MFHGEPRLRSGPPLDLVRHDAAHGIPAAVYRHTTFTAFGASTQAFAPNAAYRAKVVATRIQATIGIAVCRVRASCRRAGALDVAFGMRPTDLDGSRRGHASKEAERGECNDHG